MSSSSASTTQSADHSYPGRILEDILEKVFNTSTRATNCTRVKGGFSREIWAFDAHTENQSYQLILCKDGGSGAVDTGRESLSRTEEFQLLKHLQHYANAVPEVICAGDSFGQSGQAYLIMTRVAGDSDVEPLINAPHYQARQKEFSRQMASVLADIHRTPR